MRVPDEVEAALKESFRRSDLGNANLSTVDSEANACVMRVLARRGLGPYKYAFVWPVLTVEVVPDTPDARRFVYDIRELVRA
jgi:hypothetical protein